MSTYVLIRVKQHVPKLICSCSSFQKRILRAHQCKYFTQPIIQSLASDSIMGFHLLQNPNDSRFSILAQGRSPFYLSAFEVTFIKISSPAFFRQKEFVDSLKIVLLLLRSPF